jgi:hypothetical protein
MLHTLHFSLQKAFYFIMLTFFWFLYYSQFTYRMCQNLNVKLRCQKVNSTEDFAFLSTECICTILTNFILNSNYWSWKQRHKKLCTVRIKITFLIFATYLFKFIFLSVSLQAIHSCNCDIILTTNAQRHNMCAQHCRQFPNIITIFLVARSAKKDYVRFETRGTDKRLLRSYS